MTKQSICIVLILLLPAFLPLVGCDQRQPAERAAARDNILKEVLGKPVEAPTESSSVPDTSTNLESSNVKQFIEAESATSTGNTSEPAKPNTAATSESASTKPLPKITIDDPTRPWIGKLVLPRETWEVQYLGNNPVGFFVRRTSAIGGGSLRHEASSRMRVSIKGETFEQLVQLTTIEQENGELLSIDGSMQLGPNKQTFAGKIRNEAMSLTGEENGKAFSVSIPWERKFRGPFAVEQSMLRNPLQPRETRRLKYFDPLLRKLIDGRLEASDYNSTPTMLGGFRDLLEVRNIGIVGESGSQALLWVDSKGEGFKSYIPANDILSFRTEPIVAQVVESMADLRNLDSVSVPLAGAVDRLTKNQKAVTYEVKHKTSDPFRLFADRVGQQISSVDALTANVTVFRGGREANTFQDADELKKEERGALSASTYVPTDSSRILERAKAMVASDKSISPDSATNFQKAKACRSVIQRYISLKDFDRRIGLFTNVLRTKQANCIEHALFFAAHCRALGIPTRIAMGLKYNRNIGEPAMKFHAWVEIREGKRWIPIDSSDDLSSANAEESTASTDRFKIKESDFNIQNPYVDILNVFRLLPELNIKVLSADPPQ